MTGTCCNQKNSLVLMILLTSIFFLLEIIVGYLTKSMALVADSFHMLSDVASLFVGYFAVKLSQRKDSNDKRNTFGWVRAEVLGALINAVFLVALCFSIFVESLTRFVEPVMIEKPLLVLTVGGAGLFINLFGMCIFHGHIGHGHSHGHSHGHNHGFSDKHAHGSALATTQSAAIELTEMVKENETKNLSFNNEGFTDAKEIQMTREKDSQNVEENNQSVSVAVILTSESDGGIVYIEEKAPKDETQTVTGNHQSQMNIRGVYLHVLGDALGSVVVVISALVVYFVDESWVVYLDPSMSILLVIIILHTSIPLLKESSLILLQTVPTHIEIQDLTSKLLGKFPLIKNVHDFHIWQLAGSKIIASLHVKVVTRTDYMNVSEALKKFFHNEGIHSTTIQPEFIEDEDLSDRNCLLECASESCNESKCCKLTTKEVRNYNTEKDSIDIKVIPIESEGNSSEHKDTMKDGTL